MCGGAASARDARPDEAIAMLVSSRRASENSRQHLAVLTALSRRRWRGSGDMRPGRLSPVLGKRGLNFRGLGSLIRVAAKNR